MGNAAVNGSFSTSRPFGAMSQQPTPPEVKQAMEENPGCAFSTSSRSSFTSMNGDVSRKTVQSWLMTCPNQPTMKILEEKHTETGDSARASAGAGGGMQLPGPEDWPGLSGAGHSIFDDMGEIGKLLPSGAVPASGIMDPVAIDASVPYVLVCACVMPTGAMFRAMQDREGLRSPHLPRGMLRGPPPPPPPHRSAQPDQPTGIQPPVPPVDERYRGLPGQTAHL